eukprot:1149747-Pelagomonas_calceolata.AAC.6
MPTTLYHLYLPDLGAGASWAGACLCVQPWGESERAGEALAAADLAAAVAAITLALGLAGAVGAAAGAALQLGLGHQAGSESCGGPSWAGDWGSREDSEVMEEPYMEVVGSVLPA